MPNSDGHRLVVITGGPGAGKTTLIEALAAAGHAVMPEAGRAVIRAELAAGGSGLPWQNRTRFAELMVEADLCSHQAALALPGTVFFDRGLVDIAAYLELCGLPVPDALSFAIERCRYRETVFIAPHWPEIYRLDAERKQDLAEARRTFERMASIYPRHGYRLLELPRAGVAERVAFVQASLGLG